MTGGAARTISLATSDQPAYTAVLNASAVRDLVLALTNQPLPSALPNAVQASSPRTGTYDGCGSLKAAVQPSSVSQSAPPVAAGSVKGEAVVAPTTVGLVRPSGSGGLSGGDCTSDKARESKGISNSGEVGGAKYGSSTAGGLPSSPLSRDISAMVCSGSQALPNVEDESSFRVFCAANREQSLQPHRAETHGGGQPKAEDNGCGSGEGKEDERLMHQARGNQKTSSFADGADDEIIRKLGRQSSNSNSAGNGEYAHRLSSTGAAWNGIRWRGVDEVSSDRYIVWWPEMLSSRRCYSSALYELAVRMDFRETFHVFWSRQGTEQALYHK